MTEKAANACPAWYIFLLVLLCIQWISLFVLLTSAGQWMSMTYVALMFVFPILRVCLFFS